MDKNVVYSTFIHASFSLFPTPLLPLFPSLHTTNFSHISTGFKKYIKIKINIFVFFPFLHTKSIWRLCCFLTILNVVMGKIMDRTHCRSLLLFLIKFWSLLRDYGGYQKNSFASIIKNKYEKNPLSGKFKLEVLQKIYSGHI